MKKTIKNLLMSFAGLLFVLSIHAQEKVLTGTVTDAPTGEVLPGATVIITGTTTGTTTDMDGKFSIRVPEGGKLSVAFIGYITEEIEMGSETDIEVLLRPDMAELEEVVVTGYSSVRKSNITGAISTVEASELSKMPVVGVDRALAGKVSGVRVNQATGAPGDDVSIRIRGVGTIGNNDPLYVIDGIPTKGALNIISPSDIESIAILKDASSAAIYGSRSANGVVVITTKKGVSGKQTVSYNGYYGVQKHGKLTPMVNTAEYIDIYNEAAIADNRDVITPEIAATFADVDHMESIFQLAPVQSHQLSISDGNEQITIPHLR